MLMFIKLLSSLLKFTNTNYNQYSAIDLNLVTASIDLLSS